MTVFEIAWHAWVARWVLSLESYIILGSIPNSAAKEKDNHNTIVPALLGIEPNII
jgi:hypothetical protein